jgi:hypothetical protein
LPIVWVWVDEATTIIPTAAVNDAVVGPPEEVAQYPMKESEDESTPLVVLGTPVLASTPVTTEVDQYPSATDVVELGLPVVPL